MKGAVISLLYQYHYYFYYPCTSTTPAAACGWSERGGESKQLPPCEVMQCGFDLKPPVKHYQDGDDSA